ncbi:hypothetical protein INT45_014248 [Circinella minor]|uniref:Uncharacterized protein n=1 Tax=Circinella minor TaxID=1195481 RepID=A0A8H7SBU5_9FUNG|nr:hypothetical protein INT45_014248 [Circinella minor]
MNPAINDRNAAENADEPNCPQETMQPKEYDAGTYWVTPKMPSFALENVVLDSKSYIIFVCFYVWYPHYLVETQNLHCPYYKYKIEVKKHISVFYSKRTAESALLLSSLKVPWMEQATPIITSSNNTNNNLNTVLPSSEQQSVHTSNNANANTNSDICLPIPPRAPLWIAPRPSNNIPFDNHTTNHQHEYTPP